jgi:hypothetical protein
MNRLTRKSKIRDMVWFVDHEKSNMDLEPCEMDPHHNRLAIQKLAEYEDAEEQGKLLMTPCKIGDTVWVITSLYNLGFDGNDECEIFECTVDAIAFYKSGRSQVRLYFVTEYFNEHVRFDDFGKTVFLTKEEAEVVLEKMKGECKNA